LWYHNTMSKDLTITRQAPATMGRPRKELDDKDWLYAEKLAGMMCTCAEIGAFFGMSEDSFNRRLKERYGITFAPWSEKFTSEAKIALRRAQFQSALDGNASMLQFLGRIYLGQNPTTNVSVKTYNPKLDLRLGWQMFDEFARDEAIEAAHQSRISEISEIS